MARFPFGIRRLDTITGGGAPPGSVVLLSGEPGAGAREFLYTSAVINGIGLVDEELFDLYYGQLDDEATLPEEIHYVSFTDTEAQLRQEMAQTIDHEAVEAGVEAVEFHDLASEYFRISPVPREWYSERTSSVSDMGKRSERGGVPEALGDRLDAHAQGNLVVIDSLTDLVTATGEFEWEDVPMLLRGISRAAYDWQGLVLAHVNQDALTDREHGQLVDAVDGAMLCRWSQGGSMVSRTMLVQQFRGVLSRLEEEDIAQFETEIGGTGFDISDIQKIR
jgi:KaiC/GvpD/RAD55 family RecA-like ATPase